MDTLGFALLLILAIGLSFAFSYLQHLAYSRTVRAVATDNDRTGVVVVSGRGRGMLRGCVVILAIDTTTRKILDARSMSGSTMIARFHPAPRLLGPLRSAEERATSTRMAEAIRQATTQFRDTSRTRSGSPRTDGTTPAARRLGAPAAAAWKGSRA